MEAEYENDHSVVRAVSRMAVYNGAELRSCVWKARMRMRERMRVQE